MTLAEFKALKELENRRVRMIFTDGQEVIARLFSITIDMDESQYLIYDNLEWSALPQADMGDRACYVPGEELVSCSVYDLGENPEHSGL